MIRASLLRTRAEAAPEESMPTDRHIRVFVSSAIRDMQAERDHLVKFVFPRLRKLCESRGCRTAGPPTAPIGL